MYSKVYFCYFYFLVLLVLLKGKNIQKADVLYRLLSGIRTHVRTMTYYELNVLARTIGNSLFDMSATWSGYKSQELLDLEAVDPKAKKCAEHFYPRQVSGWRIVEHMIRYGSISKPKLIDLIKVFTQVHYTTATENSRLVPYQKYGVFISPEHSYKQANVDLVKVKDVD